MVFMVWMGSEDTGNPDGIDNHSIHIGDTNVNIGFDRNLI